MFISLFKCYYFIDGVLISVYGLLEEYYYSFIGDDFIGVNKSSKCNFFIGAGEFVIDLFCIELLIILIGV